MSDGLSGLGTCFKIAGAVVNVDGTSNRQSNASHLTRKRLDGPFDVLQGKAAKVVKVSLHPAHHGFMYSPRDYDAACWCFPFQPRGHVDAISIESVAINDQVAEVQTHA